MYIIMFSCDENLHLDVEYTCNENVLHAERSHILSLREVRRRICSVMYDILKQIHVVSRTTFVLHG